MFEMRVRGEGTRDWLGRGRVCRLIVRSPERVGIEG